MMAGTRPLITTYYGPGKHKPVVKITRSSRIEETLPNIVRHMTANDYGAVVAECVDEEYGELLYVATYMIGESFKVMFQKQTSKVVCVTNL